MIELQRHQNSTVWDVGAVMELRNSQKYDGKGVTIPGGTQVEEEDPKGEDPQGEHPNSNHWITKSNHWITKSNHWIKPNHGTIKSNHWIKSSGPVYSLDDGVQLLDEVQS
ncbi:hypothetical protein WISP_07593 [Willisornis vidua]|uniref:Uncharacterized protein n=1 Tax=Willisornis vidua TaxID=1566151 RepID=A0ABQ9DY21_9PASS|nr:hypothetical protein WISP_07593 [Willisornis vidua]